MRLSPILSSFGLACLVGCASPEPPAEPTVDASGLVRIPSKPGNLYAHPSSSIDDYDDILLGDVKVSYAPQQQPLSEPDTYRLRTIAYDIVTRQIPAAGQLAAAKAGPCTVELGVQLSDIEFAKAGAREDGGTTISLDFRDSVTGNPIVRYGQHRELESQSGASTPDLERLKENLEVVATDLRVNFRDALPLNASGARSAQGCKGTIGEVRKASKQH
jgi:hypothetical protein